MVRALWRGMVVLGWLAAGAAGCTSSEVARQQYLDKGNAYFEQKKYAEAIIEYRNAVGEDPRFGQARFKLAQAYEAAGNRQRAYQEYVRAADLLPDDHDVQLAAAAQLILANQLDDARARVERVVTADPRNVRAQVMLGSIAAGLGDFDAGVRRMEEAIRLDPARGVTYANLAALRVGQGRPEEARAAFQRAVDVDPTSTLAWTSLANFHLVNGSLAEAELALQKVLELDQAHEYARRAIVALYMNTGRASQVEPHLQRLTELSPSADARFALADFYMSQGWRDQARAVLRPMVGQGRDSARAEARLAQMEYTEKQTARAHALLDAILDREPRNSDVLLMKARWLFSEGKTPEALKRASDAVGADPSASSHYLLGTIQLAAGSLDAAAKSFAEVLRLNPSAAGAELQLSRLSLARGDVDTSVQRAGAALKGAPGNPAARSVLVRGLIAKGDLSRARMEVGALMKEYPNVSLVHALNGRLLAEENELVRARAEYEEALRLDPNSLEALNGVVALHMRTKNTREARAVVDRFMARVPDRPEVMVMAARVYEGDGDPAAAERLLTRVISIAPEHAAAYGALAEVYLGQQKLEQAVASLDKMVAKVPSNVGAATMAAMIVERQGKPADAKRRYRAILAANPTAGVAANNLAWLHAEEGTNLDEALAFAQTAVRALPGQAHVHDTLGWVLYKKGLHGQAVAAFEEAVAKNPGVGTFQYHLGLAHAGNGNTRRAREALERALKLKLTGPEAVQAQQALTRVSALGG